MLDREWFSPADLAALKLPGMPDTKRGVQLVADAGRWQRSDWREKHWRMRAGRGGGVEFHYSLLPPAAQAQLSLMFAAAEETARDSAAKAAITREAMAARYEALPRRQKDEAEKRLKAIQAIEALELAGVGRCEARLTVARQMDVSASSLSNWENRVANVAAHDRLFYLASHYAGRQEAVECTPEAWEFLKANYLRPAKPTFQQCYRDLKRVAAERGWTIPSERTLMRRMEALPEGIRVLMREGSEALKRMYPAQERDRGIFHALEAVNADGHKIDVFVKWPGVEKPVRALMVAFQDLYSGLILSYRIERSESKDGVRLAFGQLVEKYGIPEHCYLDNGRAFASKWLTGGTPNRYRFKVKDEDPAGIMTTLGVQVHWTTPYHGQAKPIERAFRDLASDLAKDIRFEGAYTGPNPMEKPDNYASRAVPLDLFLKVVAERVVEHNSRPGRRSKVADGRSFLETFNVSYAEAPIRKATPEQRRVWLLAAEAVQAARVDGALHLLGNRYWGEFLHELRGQKLVVRFDPQAMHADLHVYRLDGSYLGAAPCVDAAGFADAGAARDHARSRGDWVKAKKRQTAAEVSMSLSEAAALLPTPEPEPEVPEPKIVRLVTRGSAALKPIEATTEEDEEEIRFAALRQTNRASQARIHLRAVPLDD